MISEIVFQSHMHVWRCFKKARASIKIILNVKAKNSNEQTRLEANTFQAAYFELLQVPSQKRGSSICSDYMVIST